MHVHEKIVPVAGARTLRLVKDEGVYFVERKRTGGWYFLGSVEPVVGNPADFNVSVVEAAMIEGTYLDEPLEDA